MMDKDAIANLLFNYVLQTPDTGNGNSPLNKALGKLRTRIEDKIDELSTRLNTGKGLKPKWAGVIDSYNNQFDIVSVFQAQVCKWADFRNGKTRRLEYKVGQIGKVADSSGSLSAQLGTRTYYPKDKDLGSDGKIGKFVNAYFHELFCANGAPLKNVGDMLDALNAQYIGRYCVTLSMDFYYTRPLTQLGLHKDTTGNTLFVGLHYDNSEDMVGPEYMYDFWPKFQERTYSPHTLGKQGDVDAGVTFWPKRLRDGLEIARARIKNANQDTQDLLHVTQMSPSGLITFVDELIFHQTPLTRRRIRGPNENRSHERRVLFKDAAFNDFQINLMTAIGQNNLTHQHPPRLRREFSETGMENYWKNRGTGGKARRSFIRFWAMIEPVQWFVK